MAETSVHEAHLPQAAPEVVVKRVTSTFIGSKWGAGTVGTYDWQVGDGTSVHTVTMSDDPIKNDHPQHCNPGAQWQMNQINTFIQWTIHWENGGVSC